MFKISTALLTLTLFGAGCQIKKQVVEVTGGEDALNLGPSPLEMVQRPAPPLSVGSAPASPIHGGVEMSLTLDHSLQSLMGVRRSDFAAIYDQYRPSLPTTQSVDEYTPNAVLGMTLISANFFTTAIHRDRARPSADRLFGRNLRFNGTDTLNEVVTAGLALGSLALAMPLGSEYQSEARTALIAAGLPGAGNLTLNQTRRGLEIICAAVLPLAFVAK